jgi:hypothetical protein
MEVSAQLRRFRYRPAGQLSGSAEICPAVQRGLHIRPSTGVGWFLPGRGGTQDGPRTASQSRHRAEPAWWSSGFYVHSLLLIWMQKPLDGLRQPWSRTWEAGYLKVARSDEFELCSEHGGVHEVALDSGLKGPSGTLVYD